MFNLKKIAEENQGILDKAFYQLSKEEIEKLFCSAIKNISFEDENKFFDFTWECMSEAYNRMKNAV